MHTRPYTIDDLLAIMDRLRSPDGCPWDQQQTHQSIKNHLIEECYELIEAIDQEDYEGIKEEAGDLLLHVVFHAQIAKEADKFNFSDIVQTLVEKLTRRHPHVFGQQRLNNAEDVVTQWHEIKKMEKPERSSPLDGIPRGLPALQRAWKLQKIAADNHLDWENSKQIIQKIREETDELSQALHEQSNTAITEELGDLFFTIINLARHLDINPEDALNHANQKFQKRLLYILETASKNNHSLSKASPSEIDKLWQKAKAHCAGAGAGIGAGASTTA
jgi:tetrapyrrole methylase family protein/MazG family protein